MKFLHTADWQLGKPFAGIEDIQKRSALQQERIEVIKRIGELAAKENAEFILVAGDLFDSSSASKSTVAAACSAIGQLKIPVVAIPGNHDHGGPGSLWEQEFFQREQRSLAPNLHVLLKAEPFELDSAILFPCPLSRKAESTDTTAWLRSDDVFSGQNSDKARIILAHGSTQAFGSQSDEEGGYATNQIDLSRLPEMDYDYLALGDWHGTKKVGSKAWYSGTPEVDHFIKGDENDPGNVLLVEARRAQVPEVTLHKTARLGWWEVTFDFPDDTSLESLRKQLDAVLGQRANQDLLRLNLTGSLGIEASNKLEQLIESLEARLLRLKLANETVVAPTEEEIESLTHRHADPLIATVARRLLERVQTAADSAATAQIALRELHAAVARPD